MIHFLIRSSGHPIRDGSDELRTASPAVHAIRCRAAPGTRRTHATFRAAAVRSVRVPGSTSTRRDAGASDASDARNFASIRRTMALSPCPSAGFETARQVLELLLEQDDPALERLHAFAHARELLQAPTEVVARAAGRPLEVLAERLDALLRVLRADLPV